MQFCTCSSTVLFIYPKGGYTYVCTSSRPTLVGWCHWCDPRVVVHLSSSWPRWPWWPWVHPDECGLCHQWIIPARWVASALSYPSQTDGHLGISWCCSLVGRDDLSFSCPQQRPDPRSHHTRLDSASRRRGPTAVSNHSHDPRSGADLDGWCDRGNHDHPSTRFSSSDWLDTHCQPCAPVTHGSGRKWISWRHSYQRLPR